MLSEYYQLIIWIILWIFFSYLIFMIHFHAKIANIKKKSVNQSRNTILWEINEKITPILPNFPYQTKDLVFLGKWIDYIVFNGLSSGKLKEIIFLEIKSWNSQLNKNENMIKDYLRFNSVKYEIMRMNY
jgi:predicted Holliday junction resolvase-like endonuclease